VVNGAVFVFNAQEMIKQVDNPANAPFLSKIAIDDLPLNQLTQRSPNAAIDVQADYRIDPSNPDSVVFKVFDPSRAPLATGGFPGGIAVQKGPIPQPETLEPVPAGSSGGSPTTPGFDQTNQFTIDTEVDPTTGEVFPGSTNFDFALGVTDPTVSLKVDGQYLTNITITDAKGNKVLWATSKNMQLQAANKDDVFRTVIGVNNDPNNPLNTPGTHSYTLTITTAEGQTSMVTGRSSIRS
jgi:hypothetical protein